MKRKVFNFKLLILLLILTIIIVGLFKIFPHAKAAVTEFSGGDGTAGNPYIISTVADLQKLATDVNNGTTYLGEYFKLSNDISLSGVKNWNPIGYSNASESTTRGFEGIFDGDNYSITDINMTLTRFFLYTGNRWCY